MYEYSALLPPLELVASTTYWIEITNSPDGDCDWFWAATPWTHSTAYQDGRMNGLLDGYDAFDVAAYEPAFCIPEAIRIPSTSCYPPPPNDDCADALPLTDPEVWIDTNGATTTGAQRGDLGRTNSVCDFRLGDEEIHRDIWFQFAPECSGSVEMALCGGDFDSKLAISEGASCTPSPRMACNDDACGDDPMLDAALVFDANLQETYLLQVGGYRNDAGTGWLMVTYSTAPTADVTHAAGLANCFTGSCSIEACDPPLYGLPCCSSADYDADGDVDQADHLQLLARLSGP